MESLPSIPDNKTIPRVGMYPHQQEYYDDDLYNKLPETGKAEEKRIGNYFRAKGMPIAVRVEEVDEN